MLTIRLRRTGAKRDPHYRVVVIDRKAGRDGPFIEILGHYHPRRQPAEVTLDMDRTRHWVDRGARMSDTVRTLYRGIETGRIEPGVTGGGPRPAPTAGESAEGAADPPTEEAGAADDAAAETAAVEEDAGAEDAAAAESDVASTDEGDADGEAETTGDADEERQEG